MSLFRPVDTAGSGLTAHRLWMDVIAENLANVNTTRTVEGGPYRRKVPLFAERLDDFMRQGPGDGVRVVEIAEDDVPPRLAYEPDHPDANDEGYVAYPNVNVVREMADMMVASRAYEANLSIVESAKEMFNGALDVLRG
ncbi:MAG: flagellar basal body rod protein FlgC [Synergistaceae bacterium]|jgi:flagellar basal-body rod protein FlgC|nr:flagellar basal body rod protein FlgC [Synergistaceae bacterium]